MTISNNPGFNDYPCNGSTTAFPFTFKVFADDELKVFVRNKTTGVQTDLALEADYTVSGAGNGSGGTVTSNAVWSSDYTFHIRDSQPIEQQTDLRNQSRYAPETVETELDRLAIMVRQHEKTLNRCIKVAEGDVSGSSVELEYPDGGLESKNLTFDANGNVSASAPVDGVIAVSSAMEPVVGAATIAIAKKTLGISGTAISVTDYPYNASGDGATDDTAAFQAALSSGAKVITIPKTSAFFRITDQLSISADELTVVVDGHVKLDTAIDTKVLFSSTGDKTVFKGSGIIEGPGIYNDSTPGVNVSALIHLAGAGSSVSDIELREPITAGIIIESADHCAVSGVRVVGGVPSYSGSQHYGILVYLSHYYTINGCRFDQSDSGHAVVHAINTVTSNHGSISGNVAQTWEKLLYGYGDDCAITGNVFQGMVGNSGDCLRSIGSRCVITGNTVAGGGKGGISVFNGSDCVVTANVITDCMHNGIQVGHYGGSTAELSRNIISDNIIQMREYTGTEAIYSGIEYATAAAVDCRDISIVNNQIHDADRSGVNRAAIYVLPFSGSVFRNIKIDGNIIVNPGYEGIEVAMVSGGSISCNHVIGAGYDFGNINSLVFPTSVANVIIKDNEFSALHSRRDAGFIWQPSGSGTNEFCLKSSGGGNPDIVQPRGVFAGNAKLTSGVAGSLAAGSWAWGDNDALGFNTIYVRLSDGADPDSKAAGFIMASHSDYAILFAAGQSNVNNKIRGNRCFGSVVSHAFYDYATDLNESIDNSIGWYPLAGTVTVGAGSGFYDVSNDNVVNSASCRIYLQPVDQNAATINAGTKMAFIVTKTSWTGFRIQTQDGSAFGAAGVFSYRVDL